MARLGMNAGEPGMTKSLPLGPDLLGGKPRAPLALAPTDSIARRRFTAVT